MKSLKKIVLIASLMVLIPGFAFAGWHVKFVNDTADDIRVHIYGEHLFWQQEDASATIKSKESADMEMPGWICPTYFTYDILVSGQKMGATSKKYGAGSPLLGAACRNIKIQLSDMANYNSAVILYGTY